MLKLLLGHWKAHRKKPSLLPEDGDVHFEEPSTINPLFEDSDSSISSSKRSEQSKPLDHSQSRTDNEQNITEGNGSLQISTNSQVATEQNGTEIKQSIQTPIDSQVITQENKTKTDSTISNESTDVLIPIQSKDSDTSSITLSKTEITDTDESKKSTTAEVITESKNLQKEKHSDKIESEVPNENSVKLTAVAHEESSLGTETEETDVKSDENMRLYNQPSTSAITENKKRPDEISNGINKTHTSPSKSTNAITVGEQESKQKNSSVINASNLSIDKTKSIASPLKPVTDNSATTKSREQDSQEEKPAKLKAKAIDELIKKFQGPKTETKNETNISKTERKNSANQSTDVAKLKDNNIKNESVNTSSPSTHIIKDVHSIKKPERKGLSKTNDSKITDVPNKNSQEIEALSNIFRFPPPPPLEQLQNESSLHGKLLKNPKVNPLSRTNKPKENESENKEIDPGKTRSDSSLDRTRTASSSKPKSDLKLDVSDTKETVSKTDKQETPQVKSIESGNITKDVSPDKNKEKIKRKANESSLHAKHSADLRNSASKHDAPKDNINETKTTESTTQLSQIDSKKKEAPISSPKTVESSPQTVQNGSKKKESPVPSTKTFESSPQVAQNNSKKKVSPVSSPKGDTSSQSDTKNIASSSKNPPKSPVQIHKSSISKATSKLDSVIESENLKLHSEDSGITRGDQISSETTPEIPANDLPEQTKAVPNSLRKNKKEKKAKSVNKKICKNCRHAHNDSAPIKRSPCDDYYDGLTGVKRHHKNRHSDSWTSDLSWEERELLRRLRSRRGTVRSNTPSTKSKLSKHRFIDENYFRRHHNLRRSISDDSSFYGASLCSCDECWAMYLKEYAYGRASLRGMSPIQEICTCRNSHHNFLGRRVQFRPDIIHEASPSERTTTTPAPSVEKKKQDDDDDDDKNSQKSSKSKGGDSVSTHPEGHKEKKLKHSEDIYRFVTPWELEELDLLMRKHLLKKRRRRARCMGIMALAMVVFIGLIVAIVMVYLRRKTL